MVLISLPDNCQVTETWKKARRRLKEGAVIWHKNRLYNAQPSLELNGNFYLISGDSVFIAFPNQSFRYLGQLGSHVVSIIHNINTASLSQNAEVLFSLSQVGGI